jgi:membrane dipeptidase
MNKGGIFIKYFDLHCDTFTECYDKKQSIWKNDLHISLDQNKTEYAQVFAVWIDDKLRGEAAYNRFLAIYNYFIEQLNKSPIPIKQCKNITDINNTMTENSVAAVLSVEGGAALGGKIERLEELYSLGVRMMTLVWNGECELGCGSVAQNPVGLTDFGKKVVAKMQELGMIVDVSHLSDAGFWNVAKIAKKPFIASHSNARAICNHPRNLNDEQLKYIFSHNGLVGINFYYRFLSVQQNPSISSAVDHIEYMLSLGGEKNICIGADMDGAQMPDDFKGIGEIENLVEIMLKRNFTGQLIDDIMFNNAYNFFNVCIMGLNPSPSRRNL